MGKPSSLLGKDSPVQSFGEGRNIHTSLCNPHQCSVSKLNKLMGAQDELGCIMPLLLVSQGGG